MVVALINTMSINHKALPYQSDEGRTGHFDGSIDIPIDIPIDFGRGMTVLISFIWPVNGVVDG